jgi:hypothetical protein
VAADDDAVSTSREDRLYEAPRADAPFERVELVGLDAARVGRIGPESLEGDLLDGEGRKGGRRHRDVSVSLGRCPANSRVVSHGSSLPPSRGDRSAENPALANAPSPAPSRDTGDSWVGGSSPRTGMPPVSQGGATGSASAGSRRTSPGARTRSGPRAAGSPVARLRSRPGALEATNGLPLVATGRLVAFRSAGAQPVWLTSALPLRTGSRRCQLERTSEFVNSRSSVQIRVSAPAI